MMFVLKVGELFQPGVTSCEEGPVYNYRGGGHRFVIAMRDATAAEVEAVRHAPMKLAFTVIGDVLVFQARFGAAIPWADAVYTWHNVPEAERVRPPALTGDQRAVLEVVLVEASTGIIRALRAASMSPTMSRRLHEAIRRQADAPAAADYDAQANGVFDRFTSGQLRDRALGSCNAGDETDRPAAY